MKLKDCGHMHFIQAIKGGLLVNVLSRDSHGKPALRFKRIKGIYESDDAGKLCSGSRVKRKGRSALLPFDHGKANTEMPTGGKIVESELKGSESNREGDDDRRSNSEADDDSPCSMTLMEIKKRSKNKKRKFSELVDSVKHSLGGTSSCKDDVTLQLKEDAQLDNPLSCLKLKLSKTNTNTVARASCTSPKSPISGDASTKQILNYQSSSQNTVNVHELNPNVEALTDNLDSQNVVHVTDGSTFGYNVEMGYGGEFFDEMPEGGNGKTLEMGESFSLGKEIPTCVASEVSNEYLEPEESSLLANTTEDFGVITKESFPEVRMSLPSFVSKLLEETSTTHSVLYHSSTEAIPFTNDLGSEKYPSIQQGYGFTSASDVKMGYGGECFDEMPEGGNGMALEMGESFSLCKKIPRCIASEVSNEYLQPEESSLLENTTEDFGETTKESFPEVHMSLPSFVSERLEEATTTHSVLYNSPVKAIPVTNDLGSEKYPSIQQGQLSCHIDSNTLIQMPDVALSNNLQQVFHYGCYRSVPGIDDNGDNKKDAYGLKPNVVESKTLTDIPDMLTTDTFQSLELCNGGIECNINIIVDEGDDRRDITPDHGTTVTNISNNLFISSQNCYSCSSPQNGYAFKDDGSLTAEKKHSSLATSASLFAHVDVALQCFSGIHSSDATDVLKDVETIKGCLCVMTENPPKKLLSTRKVISPTSQQKLCLDFNAGDSRDNMETFKCREKLFFEEQTESDNSLVKPGVERDVSIIPQKNTKKNMNGSTQLDPRGILKVPPFPCSKPSSGTECASVSTCTQKAIKFLQRQMQDIESLSTKLVKELKSMKDIVEVTFYSETCQATSSKYTSDQIKSAIEDVAVVEETTRKWLSMMARDCTRFCKIMKSAEKKSSPASPGYEVHKKKRKITFADENGGTLCHVKVYEDSEPILVGL